MPVKYGWEITEEGCFKYPLVNISSKAYKKGENTGFTTDEVLPHCSNVFYDKSDRGTLWKLKPEYL